MEEMENELISSMKRNLQRHLDEEDEVGFKFPQWQSEKLKELKRYQRENKEIIEGYTKGLDKKISQHLRKELKQGSINSIKEYNKVLGANLKQSKLLNKSFFKTNDKKVNALIKAVNNDLKVASTSALRMINDEYRQVIHKSAFFLANGTVSPQKAIDMATKDFLARGLNCIEYKDGRRVNIASYSEMAVRTASLRAQLMGDGDFRKSIGRHLVIATASNAACPLCSRWEDRVLIDDVYSGGSKKDGKYPLLSEAMKQGFLHPNCRDGVGTYYPELEDIDKSYENGKDGSESDVAYQNDLNYINQRIKQFERLSLGSLDKENINNYQQKKRLYEMKKEEIIMKKYLLYKDITKEWFDAKENKNVNLMPLTKGDKFKYKNIEYIYDGKQIKYDLNLKEKEFAHWLSTKKEKVYLNPSINEPDGISTADLTIDNELYDMKIITGKSNQILYHNIRGKENQSSNFLFEATESSLSLKEFEKQVRNVFMRNDMKFVDKIGIKKDKQFYIYKRK